MFVYVQLCAYSKLTVCMNSTIPQYRVSALLYIVWCRKGEFFDCQKVFVRIFLQENNDSNSWNEKIRLDSRCWMRERIEEENQSWLLLQHQEALQSPKKHHHLKLEQKEEIFLRRNVFPAVPLHLQGFLPVSPVLSGHLGMVF